MDAFGILAQASQQASQADVGWWSWFVTQYLGAKLAFITGSITFFGASWTVMGYVDKLKDRIYDSEEYAHRVGRLQDFSDDELDTHHGFDQMKSVIESARWSSFFTAIAHGLLALFPFGWMVVIAAMFACVMVALISFSVFLIHRTSAYDLNQSRARSKKKVDEYRSGRNDPPAAGAAIG